MGLIFLLTFSTVGAALSDLVGEFIDGTVAPAVMSLLQNAGAGEWFISLVCDGIIKGVGGVLTFLPQIALLFLCLSLLEDSGYMSRIAFIMDKPMRRFGLSGKSFIPLLMGFGCTVPAAMGARTMDNERDRRMTILLLPFMSCSAKLPVYGLIAGAFFSEHRGLVILSLYVLGVMLGILSGLIFRKAASNKQEAPFVIELPPYRMPSARNVFTHVWERVEHFLEKAGTIIFAMSVVLWFMQSFDFRLNFISDPSLEHTRRNRLRNSAHIQAAWLRVVAGKRCAAHGRCGKGSRCKFAFHVCKLFRLRRRRGCAPGFKRHIHSRKRVFLPCIRAALYAVHGRRCHNSA